MGQYPDQLAENMSGLFRKGVILTELGENLWKLYRPMLQELIREELQNTSTLQKE